VADTKRTSTSCGVSAPTRSTFRSSITRRSLAWIDTGISPTSSRNSVPPSAVSSRPGLALMAPVNEPFSWPNSSLSNSDSVSAAQLSLTKGLSARGEALCTASASTSLPTPVSPRSSTEMLPCETRSIRRCSRTITRSCTTRRRPRVDSRRCPSARLPSWARSISVSGVRPSTG
jgi:hypothetical protein